MKLALYKNIINYSLLIKFMPGPKIITLNFSINIEASAKTVWHKMLDLDSYKIWTKPFDDSSYYQGSWDLGQKILFKSQDNESGLAGKITKNEYLKVVEITYQSMLNNEGLSDSSEQSQSMKGLVEIYTFTKISDAETKLDIYGEMLESFRDYMLERWPKALEKLKEICEQ
jgi:hypothetical protein